MFPEHTYCGAGQAATWAVRMSAIPTKSGRPRARNKYAGKCHTCGRDITAGGGCIEKSSTGRWLIYC